DGEILHRALGLCAVQGAGGNADVAHSIVLGSKGVGHASIVPTPSTIRLFGILETTMKKALWTIQILLAALFLFSGISKFVMPVEEMTKGMPAWLSISFLHLIGACEILGG